jgi:hypothetical protein
MGSPAEDGVRAVIEGVERETKPPLQTQMRGALKRSGGSSLGSWRLELCLGKEKAGASKYLRIFFEIVSTGISSPFKNSFGKTIVAPKTSSAGERPVSSFLCTEAEEYPRDLLGPSGHGSACT